MRIYVDGKEAVLKAGSSFEYVSENPLFTEAEGYSLEIEFPLKSCPENILIFGALHVQGVDIKKVTFPCELDAGMFRKTGILTIVSVSEVEVKGQFLEGMSTQQFTGNVLSVYIDELDYSAYDGTDGTQASMDRVLGTGWEDLVVWDKGNDLVFGRAASIEQNIMSVYIRHVHLWKLMELVAELSGLTVDKGVLHTIPMFEQIVIANTTEDLVQDVNMGPIEGGGYIYKSFMRLNKCLPHWSLKEFFNEVGKFFGCFVLIDGVKKSIVYSPLSEYGNETKVLAVNDDFEIELGEGEDKYGERIKVKFPDVCNPDKVNICDWFVSKLSEVSIKPGSLYSPEYVATHPKVNDSYWKQRNLYIIDNEKVAVVDVEEGKWGDTNRVSEFVRFEALNQFSGMDEGTELKLIPCPIEFKSLGMIYVSSISAYRNLIFNQYGYSDNGNLTHAIGYKFPVLDIQHHPQSSLLDGNMDAWELLQGGEEKFENKYDKLFMVLHSGTMDGNGYHINTRKKEPLLGTNYADETISATSGKVPLYYTGLMTYSYDLAPSDSSIVGYREIPEIDDTQLYRYKFLGTTIPSPTGIFLINGQKFACLRITANFTNQGMSELMEGEFYRIIE